FSRAALGGHGINFVSSKHYTNTGSFSRAAGMRLDDFEPDLPELNAGDQNLARITRRTWKIIRDQNDPPNLFNSGNRIVRVEHGDLGRPILREMTLDRIIHVLARIAQWQREDREG